MKRKEKCCNIGVVRKLHFEIAEGNCRRANLIFACLSKRCRDYSEHFWNFNKAEWVMRWQSRPNLYSWVTFLVTRLFLIHCLHFFIANFVVEGKHWACTAESNASPHPQRSHKAFHPARVINLMEVCLSKPSRNSFPYEMNSFINSFIHPTLPKAVISKQF